MNLHPLHLKTRNLAIATIILIGQIGCQTNSGTQEIDIQSDTGQSEFYSGKKPEATYTDNSNPNFQTNTIDTYCPNALDSRLNIGDEAEVIIFQLSVRPAPGYDTYKDHILAEGRRVNIINGPRCVDDGWWWEIRFTGTISTGEYVDFTGWMLEADYDTYYLKKVN